MATLSTVDDRNDAISGPLNFLRSEHALRIIQHLKRDGKWNSDFLDDNDIRISQNLLQELSIIHGKHNSKVNMYSLDIFDVQSYLRPGPSGGILSEQLAIMVYSKDDDQLLLTSILGSESQSWIENNADGFREKVKFSLKRSLAEEYIDCGLNPFLRGLDFGKYNFFVESIDASDFVLENDFVFRGLDDNTFVPLVYIAV